MGSSRAVDGTLFAKGHGEFDFHMWRDDNDPVASRASFEQSTTDGSHKQPR